LWHYSPVPIYDLSVPISSGLPTYTGDPAIKIDDWSKLTDGASANVSAIYFGAHTGTHVDAPAHFIEGEAKIDSLPLDTLIGPARVIHLPEDRTEIDPEFLSSCDLENVERVLFRTRNSSFWNGEGFRKDFTHLLPEAAEMLVQRGVKLVGIDYLSIEKFHSGHHRTHIALLSRGVVIVEGLNLSNVPAGDYDLVCLPLKIAEGAGDGAPARVVLRTL
jgi:arylformamidase